MLVSWFRARGSDRPRNGIDRKIWEAITIYRERPPDDCELILRHGRGRERPPAAEAPCVLPPLVPGLQQESGWSETGKILPKTNRSQCFQCGEHGTRSWNWFYCSCISDHWELSRRRNKSPLSALLSQLWWCDCEAVVKCDASKLQLYKYSGQVWSFVKRTNQELFGSLAKEDLCFRHSLLARYLQCWFCADFTLLIWNRNYPCIISVLPKKIWVSDTHCSLVTARTPEAVKWLLQSRCNQSQSKILFPPRN